ncbi:MAG: hypothetical protein GY805_32005 [Chloroflexi bacterium]|nr:hypothetical protein [Chloroflexota bacterium]
MHYGRYPFFPIGSFDSRRKHGSFVDIEDNSCSPALSGDPQLDALKDNGGATFTHALLPSSPAIDAGDNDACPATDQRVFARPFNNICDIGAFELVYPIYLPLILNNFAAFSDLMVQDLTVSGSGVTVVIFNQGNASVTDEFWVDVYINPSTPPTGVNQTWETNGGEGLAWGIEVTDLPLVPGETMTLTVDDAYYQPTFSNFSGIIPDGAVVYAQIDSANAGSAYGAVQEIHETTGGTYNNIFGPITVPAIILLSPTTADILDETSLPTR